MHSRIQIGCPKVSREFHSSDTGWNQKQMEKWKESKGGQQNGPVENEVDHHLNSMVSPQSSNQLALNCELTLFAQFIT